jgi:hypothetical protein
MSGEFTIEEGPKQRVLDLLSAAETDGKISKLVAAGAKAIVQNLPGLHCAINISFSDQTSGYATFSWQSHSEVVKDVPTDDERQMPNAAGWEIDRETGANVKWHDEWAGMRDRAMNERIKRELGREAIL